MVVDSSALVAILLHEPERKHFLDKLGEAESRLISAATLLEVSIVTRSLLGESSFRQLDHLLAYLGVQVVPFDSEQVLIARNAFLRFGKGRHPARLNFGDCFSYALAKQTHRPLLCKGNDFPQTDILLA